MAKKRKRSKYGVRTDKKAKEKRTVSDSFTGKTITFASDTEMEFYTDYILPRFESGEIVSYDMQIKYVLQESFKNNGKTIRAIDYIADYVYTDSEGFHVRDTKGSGFLVDNVAKIKKKLFIHRYPQIDFQWVAWDKYKNEWVDWDDFIKDEKVRRKEKKAKKNSDIN